ncbi:MAG TPA: ATP-binding protein [Terriglobales bacterium]|nr:ATP-binding protein [Terriglobales bacterium]
MSAPASKTSAFSDIPRDPATKPLIASLFIAGALVILAAFLNPDWLPPYIAPRTTLLLVVFGMFTVFAAAFYIRAHDIALIQKELAGAREAAALAEHERDQAQQELVRRLQQERELEREKLQFQSQLSDYEKYASLAQLALGAAHEINNPLLGIMSHLEMEQKEMQDEDHRLEVEGCIEGAKRISSAVRGLLNYARPGPLLINKINLDRLVAEAFYFLQHQPMFRRISLEKKIPSDLPQISADANQLSQVLMNLLLNAAQAMPEGGSITIQAEKVKFDERIEITVTDTGEGIPADILPHVFEPFFTTKRGKGTGLGLSISQAYIRSHGGEIRVASLPGHGATVRFTLPIRQEGRLPVDHDEVVA